MNKILFCSTFVKDCFAPLFLKVDLIKIMTVRTLCSINDTQNKRMLYLQEQKMYGLNIPW